MTTALLIAAFMCLAAGLRLSATAPKTKNQRGTRLRHWMAFHGTVRRMH
jgi:hypothetical protein